jgi:hypothetical protein
MQPSVSTLVDQVKAKMLLLLDRLLVKLAKVHTLLVWALLPAVQVKVAMVAPLSSQTSLNILRPTYTARDVHHAQLCSR